MGKTEWRWGLEEKGVKKYTKMNKVMILLSHVRLVLSKL